MRKGTLILCLMLPALLYAQSERKFIREGVDAYEKGEYSNAEVSFRKAEEENQESFVAKYNTTTAMYGQENYEESAEEMTRLLSETTSKEDLSRLHHNIGNALLKKQQYAESIEAYKNSLRLNPDDDDTRYNLAYAQEKLREQQQQQQQQNQDQQQQQNQDQQQNQEQQEQQQQQERNQDQQEQQQQQRDQEEQQQQQPEPGELSQEEAERLLNAILQKEKEVKEEVDKKKAKAAAKTKTDKDW